MSSKAYGSLRYVDSVTENSAPPTFLFRGPSPVPGGQFDYTGLVAAIRGADNPPPTPVPDSFYLVVITLLNASEGAEISAELEYFAEPSNAGVGEVHWWETTGTSQCYFQTPPEQRAALVADLDLWFPEPLIWRTATLRSWLQNPPSGANGRPVVIYVHCDGGCDRTGEMIGAYMLRYMNTSWSEMYANNRPCVLGNGLPWPPACPNYCALQWYAFWQNTQSFGIAPLTGIGNDGGCFDWSTRKVVQGCPVPPPNP